MPEDSAEVLLQVITFIHTNPKYMARSVAVRAVLFPHRHHSKAHLDELSAVTAVHMEPHKAKKWDLLASISLRKNGAGEGEMETPLSPTL